MAMYRTQSICLQDVLFRQSRDGCAKLTRSHKNATVIFSAVEASLTGYRSSSCALLLEGDVNIATCSCF